MSVLEVRNLSVSYGEVKVLFDVSLRVESGQLVSIVGANGAGKSTLVNTISGLLAPAGGTILIDEEPVPTRRPDLVASLGLIQVPEGRKLFPEMTVEENLLMGGILPHVRAARKERIEYVSTVFPELAGRLSQVAGTLSGGEQQMLAIGRSLVARPRLLMLDEPSLGLAPLLVQRIFDVIRSLHAGGLTVLLIEQNVRRSLAMSQFAYVLENGRVVLSGTGNELLADEHTKKAYLGL